MTDAIKAQAEGGDSLPLSARKVRIRVPKDAMKFLSVIQHMEQEAFMVLCLDGNHAVISNHIVTVGLVNQSQIHPRETFKWAIRNNAVSIFLGHNHPSGNLEPSESDLAATRRLVECGKTLGIPVVDHLIVGPVESGEDARSRFLSLRERSPHLFV